MASHSHCAYYAFIPSPQSNINKPSIGSSNRPNFVLLSSINNSKGSYTTIVSGAVQLLGAPARFEASKLKVILMGEDMKNKYAGIIPRTYILSHCDFTANLTLTISHVINLEQLRGWYCKDDVVAEWKKVNGEMCLHVHCFVSGPNLLLELAAEFRYQIFSKELPLVLKAVLHGDSVLFTEHPELLDSLVRVYFHSSLPKYNKIECWGPLRDAIEGRQEDHTQSLLTTSDKGGSRSTSKLGGPKSFFQVLFAFLL